MSESKENEEGLLGSTSSRRDFLRIAGTGIAGAFVTLTLGCATMVRTQDGKNLKVWATPSGAMVQDPNLCVGCRRCEAACTVRNDGKASAYVARVKISRNLNYGVEGVSSAYALADGQHGNFRIVAQTCRQCAQPKCGDACPAGAIKADKKTGARIVDARRCVGCGACQDACPWHIATLDPETRVSTKCSLCDGDPTCAKACPTGSIKFYTWEEAEKLLWGADATSGASAVSGATA